MGTTGSGCRQACLLSRLGNDVLLPLRVAPGGWNEEAWRESKGKGPMGHESGKRQRRAIFYEPTPSERHSRKTSNSVGLVRRTPKKSSGSHGEGVRTFGSHAIKSVNKFGNASQPFLALSISTVSARGDGLNTPAPLAKGPRVLVQVSRVCCQSGTEKNTATKHFSGKIDGRTQAYTSLAPCSPAAV